MSAESCSQLPARRPELALHWTPGQGKVRSYVLDTLLPSVGDMKDANNPRFAIGAPGYKPVEPSRWVARFRRDQQAEREGRAKKGAPLAWRTYRRASAGLRKPDPKTYQGGPLIALGDGGRGASLTLPVGGSITVDAHHSTPGSSEIARPNTAAVAQGDSAAKWLDTALDAGVLWNAAGAGDASTLQRAPVDDAKRLDFDPERPIREQAKPRQLWQHTWGRNERCELTGLRVTPANGVRCKYCPVVVHRTAALAARRARRPATSGADATKHPRASAGADASIEPPVWVCMDCEREVMQNTSELTHESARLRQRQEQSDAVTKLQSRLRTRMKRAEFTSQMAGARKFQARLRGLVARRRLRRELYGNTIRPFAVRVGAIKGVRPFTQPEVYVLVEVVRGHDEDSPLNRFETARISLRESHASMFHRESDSHPEKQASPSSLPPQPLLLSPPQQQQQHECLGFNETFFVPGMDGKATLVFSVIAHDVTREELLGQALLRLRDTALWQTGGSFDLPLSSMRVTPKAQNGAAMRLAPQKDDGPEQEGASIVVDLQPAAFATSCCGVLEQKTPGDLLHGMQPASRGHKRWCVLADGWLRAYTRQSDAKPKVVVQVSRSVVTAQAFKGGKPWEMLISIQDCTPGASHVVLLPSKEQTKEWISKLKAASSHGMSTSGMCE